MFAVCKTESVNIDHSNGMYMYDVLHEIEV